MNPISNKISSSITCWLIILLVVVSSCAKVELSEPQRLEIFAKTWGLIKYHHKDIGSGRTRTSF
jgi:hypothetical protein